MYVLKFTVVEWMLYVKPTYDTSCINFFWVVDVRNTQALMMHWGPEMYSVHKHISKWWVTAVGIVNSFSKQIPIQSLKIRFHLHIRGNLETDQSENNGSGSKQKKCPDLAGSDLWKPGKRRGVKKHLFLRDLFISFLSFLFCFPY